MMAPTLKLERALIHEGLYKDWGIVACDIGIIDAQLAELVAAHRVNQALGRDEGCVIIAAREFFDGDAVSAKSGDRILQSERLCA